MQKKIMRFLVVLFVLTMVMPFVTPHVAQAATKPSTPTGLKISTKNGNPKISWKKVAEADGYRLYRMTEDDDEWVKVATITKTSYTDRKWDAAEGSIIKYRVKAYVKKDKKTTWSKACGSKKWTVPESEEVTEQEEEIKQKPTKEKNKKDASVTLGEKNALAKAKSYLNFIAFSYKGLISQLEYEGFSYEECKYGVDNCGADWFEQALKKAKSYLRSNSFSYDSLVSQLEFEEFTEEQAVYAVDNCGADWYEQVAKKAASYMKSFSFSKDRLISQLEFEGFTREQAEYGAQSVGY